MDILHPLVQSFSEKYSSGDTGLLKEISDYTLAIHPEHHMLSGQVQGRLLGMISCMIRPSRILEIGTFTGYSAICLAEGLAEDGVLHTIEIREDDARLARAFFDRSACSARMIVHTGNALEIIPALHETWDLVFIDADKPSYIEYFNLVFPRVRKNGFILADNIFFHGQVLKENIKGKSAKGIQAFNNFIRERDDIEKVVLSVRDGLYLIRKL
ncbi:MAG TPA: O-methyltransferase [Chitinophagaceae bacterium]|nr:O-methyltransferase [Chitinophagaceae bacterium]